MEAEVRERLAAAAMLSYRLMWFEADPPEEFPVQALAAVTTHDLPTVAGLWTGSDLEAQERLGLHPNTHSTAEMRSHLATIAGVSDGTPVNEVILAAHRSLACAAVEAGHGDPRRHGGGRGTPEHARHHRRLAELVTGPAGADRRVAQPSARHPGRRRAC